jgi:enoyl-CoA hydratase/carnithine racemase
MTIEGVSERMIAERDGGIGWITFNNQARRNALSLDMWESIPRIFDAYEEDPAIRVVVLRGAGRKAFVSGADISEFETARASPEAVARYDVIAEEAMRRLEHARKPTIAMIRGYCIGGGVAVALVCDLRIAGQGSRFGVPAARLGLGYRMTGVKKLVDIVGPAYAKEIFFTARHFSAAEAHEMGLLNRVVPDDELEAFVRSYAETIAENAPLTIGAVKEIIAEIEKPVGSIDRAKCDQLVKRCFASEDYIEGRRAFMEKRKPVFAGR